MRSKSQEAAREFRDYHILKVRTTLPQETEQTVKSSKRVFPPHLRACLPVPFKCLLPVIGIIIDWYYCHPITALMNSSIGRRAQFEQCN